MTTEVSNSQQQAQAELAANFVKGKQARCIRCARVTPQRFCCPCDLQHALCVDCAKRTERLDCCHIPYKAGQR